MKFNPGPWSEPLLEGAAAGTAGMEHTLGAYGEETATRVLDMAQEWVSRFTVVIATARTAGNTKSAADIAPGSGVVVRLDGDVYGVLTAAHVLRRGDNTSDAAQVALLTTTQDRSKPGRVMAIELGARRCTVDGFDNESEAGPDIAIIPLASQERSVLEGWGMIDYNLAKERWSDEERAQLREMNPWLVSVIHGARSTASEIVYRHTDSDTGSLAMMSTNTYVPVATERNGHDYLELPSETSDFSFPTHWKNDLPGTAAAEIESLYNEGVTRRVWAGTSGAGVWNLAVGTAENGLPNGRVIAQLAGICFFAAPDKGCIIAHGTKSIARIAASHVAT